MRPPTWDIEKRKRCARISARVPRASSARKRCRLRPEREDVAWVATRVRKVVTSRQAWVSEVTNRSSSLGRKSVFFCWERHLETQFREAVRVRLRMLESLDSSVERVRVVDFSISRRMVRFGVHRGRRIVVVVCWSKWRIVVMACREVR
jgi:hypothetical protein